MSTAALPTIERSTTAGSSPAVTDEFLSAVAERIATAFRPYLVVLFGSRAWGTPREDSDVDLLVVIDPDEQPRTLHGRIARAASMRGIPYDLLVRTPAEIETHLAMKDFFIEKILNDGRVLYKSPRGWGKIEVHPTMTLLEEWIEKAESDYHMALVLRRQKNRPEPAGVCFHAQQCAEKYLKAYLIKQGATPDKTHDLDDLLVACLVYDRTLMPLDRHLRPLTDYGVDPRYPGLSVTPADADQAVADARAIRRTLRRKLGL